MKFGKKLAISSKNNLIVNLYTIKISKSWKESQHKRRLSMFLCTSNIGWCNL